jgi:3-phytase
VAQDLEPESVAISEDSKTAFVTLQENNAIAVVDLDSKRITKIIAMGYKDHGLERNKLAPSDRYLSGTVSVPATLKTYPGLYGIYMPDGIASFKHEGKTYVITANEGDDRDDFLNPDETARISALTLDATAFPNGATLKTDAELGRLTVMAKSAKRSDGTAINLGDTDADSDYDKLYVLGGRSFSIIEVDSGKMVFDSGSDIERIVYNDANDDAVNRSALLNAPQLKGRMDNKGPEPENVVVGTVRGQTYAFVGLERASGILVYNVSEPTKPRFVQYIRNTTTLAEGDISPEGLKFVPANKSPNGKALLIVGYEFSGSMAVFTFE